MNAHPPVANYNIPTRPWMALGDYDPRTAMLLSEVEDWLPVLRRLGLSGPDLRHLFLEAQASRSTFLAALIGSKRLSEAALTEAQAAEAGIDFAPSVMARSIVAIDNDCQAELSNPNPIVAYELQDSAQAATTLLAPHDVAPPELVALAQSARISSRRMALATRTMLRSALIARLAPRLTKQATDGLFDWRPDLSARDRFSATQGFIAGALLALLSLLFWLLPTTVFIAIHLFSTVFFFACSGLKAAAALSYVRRRPKRWLLPDDAKEMPVYSVLVALYREADVVPQLITALEALVWPRDRLEIKLVCEADDRATIDAIRALEPRSFMEIIEVPASLPRTKPKALRYAAAVCSGEFVVLFDAEDQPHPGQLLEAYAKFKTSDRRLGCVQAPLYVTNPGSAVLSRMFAFEYAGLFRALLPFLASIRQVLPLGGTSNHFRRAVLDEVGSWDPHNVTEDADLGVRLARFGYRAETIMLPTLEAAPEELRVWLPQRTRWLKGWLQTWLVHMRHPAKLHSELGRSSFLLVQVLLAGMYFSALLHPILFLSAATYAAMVLAGVGLAKWQLWLMGLDCSILLFSYAIFLWLGWRTLTPRERVGFPIIVIMTPIYWLLTSYAAWMALIEFIRHPHRWNKTPHKPADTR